MNKYIYINAIKFKVFEFEEERQLLKDYNSKIGNYENEEWKEIDGFNYEISNYGRVRNLKNKKIKELKFQLYGMQVVLWKNAKGYTFTISRLVANYFIHKLKTDNRVRHLNLNIRDNYYKNLFIE